MLHYYVKGTGRNLVFLHGWGGSIASFEFAARAMSHGYRVCNIDLPGFGSSDAPQEDWSVEDYADCVVRLLESEHFVSCILIGHSFGGRIAIKIAAKYPQLVSGVVLIDSAGIRPKLSVKKRLSQWLHTQAKKKGRQDHSGSADYVTAGKLRGTLVKVVNEDLSPDLSAITAPVLLFWGSKDKDTPLWMAKRMKRLLRDAALVVVDAGHYSYLEHGYLFLRVLDHFVKGVKQ